MINILVQECNILELVFEPFIKKKMFSPQDFWNDYQDGHLSEKEIKDVVNFCVMDNPYGAKIVQKLLVEKSDNEQFLTDLVSKVIFAENKSMLFYMLEKKLVPSRLNLEQLCIEQGSLNLYTYFKSGKIPAGIFSSYAIRSDLNIALEEVSYRFQKERKAIAELPLDQQLYLLSTALDEIPDLSNWTHHYTAIFSYLLETVLKRSSNLPSSEDNMNILFLASLESYYLPILLELLKGKYPFSQKELQLARSLYEKSAENNNHLFNLAIFWTALKDPFQATILYLMYKSIIMNKEDYFREYVEDYPQVISSYPFRVLLTLAMQKRNYNLAELIYKLCPLKEFTSEDVDTLRSALSPNFYDKSRRYIGREIVDYEYQLFLLTKIVNANERFFALYQKIINGAGLKRVRECIFKESLPGNHYKANDVMLIVFLAHLGVFSYTMSSEEKEFLLVNSSPFLKPLIEYIVTVKIAHIERLLDSAANAAFMAGTEISLNSNVRYSSTANLPVAQNKYGIDISSAINGNRIAETASFLDAGKELPCQLMTKIITNKNYNDLVGVIAQYAQIEPCRKNLALAAIRGNNMNAFINLLDGNLIEDRQIYNEAYKRWGGNNEVWNQDLLPVFEQIGKLVGSPQKNYQRGSSPRKSTEKGYQHGSSPRKSTEKGYRRGSSPRKSTEKGYQRGSSPQRSTQGGKSYQRGSSPRGSSPQRSIQSEKSYQRGSSPQRSTQGGKSYQRESSPQQSYQRESSPQRKSTQEKLFKSLNDLKL